MIIFIGGIVYLLRYSSRRGKKETTSVPLSEIERILNEDVDFYGKIATLEQKIIFKDRVVQFIRQMKFTSVGNAKHTLKDEVLIATSAIMPLYSFPDWEYRNLHEIILYDDHFDSDFSVSENKHIMGMVGDGAMNNTMILSLRALREGFEERDGSHTALHEFIHLIDKADGTVDGVPEYLIPKTLIEPWLRHIRGTISEIKNQETEINPYAATNESEFFAVISEYFFEKPGMLQREHPVLYDMLNKMFKRY